MPGMTEGITATTIVTSDWGTGFCTDVIVATTSTTDKHWRVDLPGGGEVTGRVRMVSPTVDVTTRNGLVHVDLPESPALRSGMFARGNVDLGEREALTLPQGAVQLREGFAFVFTVDAQSRVRQVKVAVGRRSGDLVEVVDGLSATQRVVASGCGFLADGDLVRVVASPAAGAAAAPVATSPASSSPTKR